MKECLGGGLACAQQSSCQASSTLIISSLTGLPLSIHPPPSTTSGRAGYGFVLYDLTSGRLALRGCMSLPYGYTGAGAEYMGLLAGMTAALRAGVRCLAVQVSCEWVGGWGVGGYQ